ncbi:hypothetical protein JCM19241_1274 [Vibrio ishigakensis]|uniref:Uncharacterized protein n=1 Tax=Vibrio ishigakensis TaxID=1481914 RepID=A0A0B8Q8M5_9VIBR|nr:hypothetical protein JCM19241_1274 [Vibrio ishigakensis]
MSLTGVQDQDRIDIGARTNQYRSEFSEGVHEISTMIELTCFDNSVLTQPSISSSN